MARIRSIHPGLFTDEAFVALSCDAQILLIGLWTEADDQGVFEWKPITMKMRLRPTKDGPVEPFLDELSAGNFIRKFEHGGRSFGAIRNFRKFQRPKSPNCVYFIPDDFRNYVSLTGPISEIPPQRERRGEEGREEEGREEEDGEEGRGTTSLRSDPHLPALVLTGGEESTPRKQSPKQQKEPAKKVQWPPGFQIDEEMHAYATDRGIPFEAVAGVWEKFENYHRSKGSVFKDWRRAWHTWIANEIEYRKSRRGTAPTDPRSERTGTQGFMNGLREALAEREGGRDGQ